MIDYNELIEINKDAIATLIKAADKILPSFEKGTAQHHSEFKNIDEKIGIFGGVPNTREWAITKLTSLEPTDIDGIREWQKYMEKKLDEKIDFLYMLTDAYSA